ncbi:hypothetical protein GCM10009795_009870 [Nocardioides hankookensis]|uniref:DUF4430 domain-containing protein n=1 Tax=Nocardioides hankookensis TaxID=443157 RepID=A0ABW1LIA0_9ACTN
MSFVGVRLAAACLLAAAAGVGVPASAASAATCSSADGVSVVVDFHELGGGVQSACVADGGGDSATSLFSAAGFPLTYVQRQAGFVCRVAGQPASDPCINTPPADAYWGLWWSDGTSGQWTYATTSAGGLKVPEGGYVAFSWNGSSARSAPGASPAVHPAAPTKAPSSSARPTPTKPTSLKPTTTKPTSVATPKATSAGGAASQSPTSGESASSRPSPSAVETTPSGAAGKPTKSPGGVDGEMLPADPPSSSDATTTASDPVEPADSGGLPTWVGPVVVVLLFAAGGTVAVVRRRGHSTS